MRAFDAQTQATEVSRHPRLRAPATGAPPQNSDRSVLLDVLSNPTERIGQQIAHLCEAKTLEVAWRVPGFDRAHARWRDRKAELAQFAGDQDLAECRSIVGKLDQLDIKRRIGSDAS